jgi:hypothetical protein
VANPERERRVERKEERREERRAAKKVERKAARREERRVDPIQLLMNHKSQLLMNKLLNNNKLLKNKSNNKLNKLKWLLMNNNKCNKQWLVKNWMQSNNLLDPLFHK